MTSEDATRAHPPRKTLYRWTGIPDKTLWDWLLLLGMLAIPFAIILGLIWFSTELNQAQVSVSESISEQHQRTDLQIGQEQEQDTVLDTYLDRMSELVLNDNLTHSKPADEVREVARDRTLATLLRLDAVRKGVVLQYLYQSGLILKGDVIVSLVRADLSGAKLHGADLAGADLSGADLSGADLSGANLSATVLINTNLSGATMPDGSTNA